MAMNGALLKHALRGAEITRAKRKPTDSLDAYDCYLLAMESFHDRSREALDRALSLLRRAIQYDPNYSVAKAFAAHVLMLKKVQNDATHSDVEEAIHLAREALLAVEDEPRTLRYAGQAIAFLDRDFDGAVAALERAVALSPNSAHVLAGSGWVETYSGNPARAVEQFHRAIRLSPLDPEKGSFLNGLALAHFVREEYGESLSFSLSGIQHKPRLATPYRFATVALSCMGRLEEAREMGQRLLTVAPNFTIGGQIIPLRDERVARRFADALRQAGLPE
jgi:adenylate cyclase